MTIALDEYLLFQFLMWESNESTIGFPIIIHILSLSTETFFVLEKILAAYYTMIYSENSVVTVLLFSHHSTVKLMRSHQRMRCWR